MGRRSAPEPVRFGLGLTSTLPRHALRHAPNACPGHDKPALTVVTRTFLGNIAGKYSWEWSELVCVLS